MPKLKQWYAEQIADSISGDGVEVEATLFVDPGESVLWCGVLDPSIPEPEVIDWSEDWSFRESPPCEALAAEANRKFPQDRSAVATAKQNRSGFSPPANALASRKGTSKGKLKGKTKDSSYLICGRSGHFGRQCHGRQW